MSKSWMNFCMLEFLTVWFGDLDLGIVRFENVWISGFWTSIFWISASVDLSILDLSWFVCMSGFFGLSIVGFVISLIRNVWIWWVWTLEFFCCVAFGCLNFWTFAFRDWEFLVYKISGDWGFWILGFLEPGISEFCLWISGCLTLWMFEVGNLKFVFLDLWRFAFLICWTPEWFITNFNIVGYLELGILHFWMSGVRDFWLWDSWSSDF